ncbi:hypothetical protein [Nocardia testacea]|uniref:hypothetical protein n=1 Tax=Nocardia testacea TaxID=248551 RepID=UPI000584CCF2|nr:hypothetical protein [Nocardia testacea]
MAGGSDSDGYTGPIRLVIVIAVLLICCCGGALTAVGVPLGEMMSVGKKHYNLQCDIALGPEAGASTAATATTTAASVPPSVDRQQRPEKNPYAELTFDPDDPNVTARDLACASAMKTAPIQDEPWQQVNTGPAVSCAADLALRYPEAGGTATMADYARDVIYSASIAGSTGQCAPTRAPAAVVTENCGDPTAAATSVILPATVGDQGYCGQAVDPKATSPGDLVFWEYVDRRATRVGVALGPGELVTVDSGKFVRLRIPEDAEIQIKRVLGDAG